MIYPINESLRHFQMSKLSKQMRIYTILSATFAPIFHPITKYENKYLMIVYIHIYILHECASVEMNKIINKDHQICLFIPSTGHLNSDVSVV